MPGNVHAVTSQTHAHAPAPATVGCTYYKVKPKVDCGGFGPLDEKTCINTPAGVSALVAAIPFAGLFSGYLCMVTVVPQMARERSSFYRERFSKMYSPEIHGLAYFLSEIPYGEAAPGG